MYMVIREVINGVIVVLAPVRGKSEDNRTKVNALPQHTQYFIYSILFTNLLIYRCLARGALTLQVG